MFQYEEASIAMFDYMVNLKANQLKPVFENYGLTEEDRVGIKELIVGKPLRKNAEGAEVMGNFEDVTVLQFVDSNFFFLPL